MYVDQFTPWQPGVMLIETVGADLAIASAYYAGVFCCIEVEEYLRIREEVVWIIAEMMELDHPFSNGPGDDDETDCPY